MHACLARAVKIDTRQLFDIGEARPRGQSEKFTRRLQAVKARRPCVLTWARPRAHVIRPKTEPRRAPTPIRHNDPADAAPPATRYRTGSSKRERQQESSRRASNPPFRAKLGTQKGGQKRHTRGPQGSLPFRRIRRRRPGSLASAWRHEAARTTYEELAPRRSPAAADDHPAASW